MLAHQFVISLLGALTLVPPNTPGEQLSARQVFGAVKASVCFEILPKPKDVGEWTESLREWGLKPLDPKKLSGMWSGTTEDGEVRAQAFFQAEENTFMVLYFPNQQGPPPPAVTGWLLSQPQPTLAEGDALEIQLPTREDCGAARHNTSVLMSLTTGQLVRLQFTARLKKTAAK